MARAKVAALRGVADSSAFISSIGRRRRLIGALI
jgi:hypothetical protein